jgi:hypothetical protein
MKGVRVDPAARTACVGAGCTQRDVDHATHAFGLAVPAGIISTTGMEQDEARGYQPIHTIRLRKTALFDRFFRFERVLTDAETQSARPDLLQPLPLSYAQPHREVLQ